MSHAHRREALFDVCCLLTVQGIALADLTPAALLHHAHETRRARALRRPANTKYANRFAGLSAWNVLHRIGHFPAGTPATIRAAMHRGQLSIEQMLDRYPIGNHAVRQLLLDYFTRRAADTDYADLLARRARAETEGWLGEIEGIDLTLRFLTAKRADATRVTRAPLLTITPLSARQEPS